LNAIESENIDAIVTEKSTANLNNYSFSNAAEKAEIDIRDTITMLYYRQCIFQENPNLGG
tara:strand:+ start:488 stop:667 length:180 start_codon:yes stop_codon:yes gene_type:complete